MQDPGAFSECSRAIRDLLEHLFPGQCDGIDDHTILTDVGVLDSLSVVEFVLLLETRFHIRINAPDITPEHFASIAAIAAFVEARQRTAAAS